MRGREFIMKDAYSFDKDVNGLDQSYDVMYETYSRIFTRFNLRYKAVLADTGAIGGTGSHQFMALSEVGESNILYCDSCSYAADEEKAAAVCTLTDDSQMLEIEEVHTPKQHTIEEVSNFLGVDPSKTVKCVLYKDNQNNELVAAFVRGDREVNEIKLVNALGIAEAFLGFASDDDIKSLHTYYGFIGPVGLNCKIIVDNEVAQMKNFICGANKYDYHLKNVNFGRDFNGTVIDLRKAVSGDLCPVCGQPMNIERGIEVGQIFKLGTKYSSAMNCTYTDETGTNVPMVMGCYGIGVTRTMSSIIEQHHDEFGIKWPLNVAPYHVVVIPVKYADEAQKELADKIYETLKKAHVEVILDDRNAGFGFKAKDWELIGIPYQIVVGREAANGIVEFKVRETNEKTSVNSDEAVAAVIEAVRNI